MLRNLKLIAVLGAVAASTVIAGNAQAGTILGLVDGTWIFGIDSGTRKVMWNSEIKGAGRLVGFDVRPADGALYGITGDGSIVTIDPKSGKATQKSKLSEQLKPGVTWTFDFNPVADRLRLMGSDGTSLRINVDDGKATVDGSHKYKEGDSNAGKTPKVIAGAYSNSFKGTTATALYNVDAATGALVTQAPPNDGVLNTIGALGVKLDGKVAFNIVTQGEDNKGWLVTGRNLYSVDLKSGKATLAGKIEGLPSSLIDIAWID